MKKISIYYLYFALLFITCSMSSCTKEGAKSTSTKAVFSAFAYSGHDDFYNTHPLKANEYYNPILNGFYPDPSVCKKGNDYYLVTSSFVFFPGIPIFHSTDLVHWKQLGYVLNRNEQLPLQGCRTSGGIYAPTIRYNAQNQTFYLINTNVNGIGNFIVKTKDPNKDWGNPILLPEIKGIDPSLFFDDNNKAYIVYNDIPPKAPLWEGHRALWLLEYDLNTDKTVGTPKLLVNGGVDITKHPVWIEAPHIYKKDGNYFLMAAEGGTAENHSEVIFKSATIWGPYLPAKTNPILTQRDLPEARENKVTCSGHADLFQDENHNWWAVFLACRPYDGKNYNTGRETFLLPVNWKGEFPIILPSGEAIPLIGTKPNNANEETSNTAGNYTFEDNFNGTKLNFQWNILRNTDTPFYALTQNTLQLTPLNINIQEINTPAFVGIRQHHLNFESEVTLEYTPHSNLDLAGMVCFQNESHNFVFGKTIINDSVSLVLYRTETHTDMIQALALSKEEMNTPLTLKVVGKGGTYSFYYKTEKHDWELVADAIDATNLSTCKAGGFNGSYIGLYATHANWNTLKKAFQKDFTMGVAVEPSLLHGEQGKLIAANFGSITAENAFKPINVLKKDGSYNFTNADSIVQFVRKNHLKLRGHTLVWHNQTPDWFFQDKKGKDLTQEQLYARMKSYMTAVINHFSPDVYCWDVVNEAISDKEGEMYRSEKSGWYRICKEHYIAQAFRTAHAINPKIKLYYNDYNLTQPEKRNKVYQLLKALKAQGVPIDGIGMQGHWSMFNFKASDLQNAIDSFSSLGLEIQITELDLTVYPPYHGDGAKHQPHETKEFTNALEQQQAKVYQSIFEVLHANSSKITGVTFWGLADNHTWLDQFPVNNRKDDPLLFNTQLQPKKAFFEVLQVVQ